MTRLRRLCPWIVGVFLLFVNGWDCAPLFKTAWWQWNRSSVDGIKGDGPFVDSPRILLRRHLGADEKVLLWTARDGVGLNSVDRTVAQALLWEILPSSLRLGQDVADVDVVVVDALWSNDETAAALHSFGFSCVVELDGTQVWRKSRRTIAPSSVVADSSAASSLREGLAIAALSLVLLLAWGTGGIGRVGIVLANLVVMPLIPLLFDFPREWASVFVWGWLLGIFLWLLRRVRIDGIKLPRSAWFYFMPFFVVCACLVLPHGLLANNGLGVYGGKAKLWWLSAGIPSHYFTESGYSVLQPAYPSGFSLLIWCVNALSGGVAEWLVQLLPPLFMAMILASICSRIKSKAVGFLVFSLLLSWPELVTATQFYPEPLMILFALSGIELILTGCGTLGFLLIGLCGWVKCEGIIEAVGLWLVRNFLFEEHDCRLRSLACALLPGSVWYVLSRLLGANLPECASFWNPDFGKGLSALWMALKTGCLFPWRYAFLYPLIVPLSVVCLVVRRGRMVAFAQWRRLVVGLIVFVGVSVVGFAYALSLSLSPDFDWHCLSLERLLLPPVLIVVWIVSRRAAEFAESFLDRINRIGTTSPPHPLILSDFNTETQRHRDVWRLACANTNPRISLRTLRPAWKIPAHSISVPLCLCASVLKTAAPRILPILLILSILSKKCPQASASSAALREPKSPHPTLCAFVSLCLCVKNCRAVNPVNLEVRGNHLGDLTTKIFSPRRAKGLWKTLISHRRAGRFWDAGKGGTTSVAVRRAAKRIAFSSRPRRTDGRERRVSVINGCFCRFAAVLCTCRRECGNGWRRNR